MNGLQTVDVLGGILTVLVLLVIKIVLDIRGDMTRMAQKLEDFKVATEAAIVDFEERMRELERRGR